MTTHLRPTKHAGSASHRLPRRRQRTTPPTTFSGTLFRLRPRLEVMEDRTLLSTFLVSNTSDSGSGSLRQAILDSNNSVGAPNTIDFDISGTGVQTIVPLSSLPAITNPVLIDGTSQPGYGGTPLIELSGSQVGGGDGLTITGAGVTIRGLDINNFSQGAGVHLTGTGATGDWIYGNFLGTDPTGTQAEPNKFGVEIDGGATQNLIGTNGDAVNDAAERNVISGNLFAGVWINGQATDGNAVAGNFIGTSVTGDVALDNGTNPVYYYGTNGGGVVIEGGASGNRIGTDGRSVDDAGQRNVIAGSDNDGIEIIGDTGGNTVAGNFIGTDVTGTLPLGIARDGVFLAGGASSNWIGVNTNGGTAVGDEGNVISGNGFDGISINANDNVVAGNKIGTDSTGTASLPNGGAGIDIEVESSNNTIGGTTDEGNVISGNRSAGIQIYLSSNDNVVAGNKIGTDSTGTASLPNSGPGIDIEQGSSNNTIGGTTDEGNVISGNGHAGIQIYYESNDNVVAGNEIGTDSTGIASVPNSGAGIDIGQYSTNNTIGGATAAAGNLITNNGGAGVVVGNFVGDISVGNQITANRIFGNAGQAIDLDDDGVTYNSSSPRQGANNFQNFPVVAQSAHGQLEGWLGGSTPNILFRIDVFASAAYGPGGAGEAEDYLGSLAATTDSQGQAVFDIPFTPPANLPIVTATATDPQGNTSEVSVVRQGILDVPMQSARLVPGQPLLLFSAASGDGIALRDPGAGPLDPTWDLTVSVSAGTLTLSKTTGLTGSGAGTSSLSYRGALSALDAALAGMKFAPPPEFHGNAILSLDAESEDVTPLQAQLVITDGFFLVTTTADSGPGSLRQAILDSNTAAGGSNTIDFAIPGTGVQTIALSSPLPPITDSVLIDGTTQPGFAGTPLIAFGGQSAGSSGPLVISGENVTIRGLAIEGVTIDATADERLIAVVAAQGATSQLSLLDAQGHVLVENDGTSSDNPDHVIEEYLAAGDYSLAVDSGGGQGASTWTTMLTPAYAPLLPIPVGLVPSPYVLAPSSIVAGDFTGDGRIDLAVAGWNPNSATNNVSVLLGNGDGTFQPAVQYATALSVPSAIVAGDFTGDGRIDLAVAGFADVNTYPFTMGEISVLLGNGDGTFQPPVTYAVGSVPSAIVTGDFTGDGRIDLAVVGPDSALGYTNMGELSVLLGNGDGTFQPAVQYAMMGSYITAIAAGDFTGDGRIDLAVAGYNGNSNPILGEVSVLLGNGDGTFQPAVQYAVGSSPSAMVAGDFTGDGHLDLAVANGDSVSVLLGNGDGTFQPQVTYAAGLGAGGILAGDFNGDGKLDLAVVDEGSSGVSVLLGNGDGTFQPQVTYSVGFEPIAIVAGDFNGDGRLDLATMHRDETVSVLLGNGVGTFEPLSQASNAVGLSPSAIVAGDFNGDGKLDLAVANSGSNDISVLLGNGDGTFQPQVTYAVGSSPIAIVEGDFNGDGRLDLAVVGYNYNSVTNTFVGEVSVLLGNGDGTFQPAVQYAAGSVPSAIVAGDFTGDGRIDLAVAGSNNSVTTPMGEVSILLGNGDGTFQPPVTYAVESIPSAIVAGDFNGDGKLDLAMAGSNYNYVTQTSVGAVSVLLSNGDGTFQPPVTYAVGSFLNSILAGDFGGDGRIDLAVEGDNMPSQLTAVWLLSGNGDGTFQPAETAATAVYGESSFDGPMVAGDFNGDGRIDLAVTEGAYNSVTNTTVNAVSVFLGNGDGTFQPQVTYAVGSYPRAIVAGDFNEDGKLDLATPEDVNDVSVLLNTGDGTFVDAGQFATTPHATPLVADVNGDGTDDVLVVDGAGNILYRQGIPGQPGTFEPPVTVNPNDPSRDIAWLPNTDQGPVLVSVDADDDAISFYVYRDGGFVRVGSLATGRLPAQIIAADLSGDGLTDLVVRNAGDGTLSVYFGSRLIGPISPLDPPTFTAPLTIPVGLGVSDVQADDTTGSGALDLVVTNKLTAQVSVLLNLGNDTFTAPAPYRAGTEFSEIDPGSAPEVTSLEATAGVAAGSFTTGGPTDLVTINPGSNTLDVLAGLGQGRFADPVAIQTASPAQVVRVADFTGNGIDDLAVLTANGLSIYLGNGQGGFLPPTTYAVPSESDGLTVADLLGNGKLDLLVGDAYGDVLVLLGNGDGTFQPYHEANQAVELAVADLTGNGSKDIIYADQGLDRVVVAYGAGNSSVLANQSTGLLDPGAVKLADLNGDGIPDLIVANSGSNNVLIYPGLGDGQFGPAINGGNGYFVGDNPVGITVANLTGPLPDLVIADKGSNQVSILLNQSEQGGALSFSAGPRLNSGGSGPVSTVVGNFTGGAFPDMLVTNSQSNDVVLLPGVGQGFFNDQNPRTYSVGTDPGPTVVGNFNGQTDLVTVNAGSNDLTLISGFEGANPTTSTITSGGVEQDTAFAFGSGGFEDLVVGNGGDGALALFEGGPAGLSLTSVENEPNLPDPTALAFSALSGGQVQFYAATAGRESAELVALSLGVESAFISSSTASSAANPVAQLVPLSESSLPLVATVLTLTIAVPGAELNIGLVETETTAVAAFLPGTGVSVGQGLSLEGRGGPGGDDGAELDVPGEGVAGAVPAAIAPWQRYVIGQDEALEQFRRENPNWVSGAPARDSASDRPDSPPAASLPTQGGPTSSNSDSNQAPSDGELDQTKEPSPTSGVEAIDMAISSLCGEDRASDSRGRSHDVLPAIRLVVSHSPRSRLPERIMGEPKSSTRFELPLAGSDRRTGEVLPPGREPGKDELDLALTSLAVATMATDWVHAFRVICVGRSRGWNTGDSPLRGGSRGGRRSRRPGTTISQGWPTTTISQGWPTTTISAG